MNQDGIARLDRLARYRKRLFQLLWRDFVPERHVSKVKTNRLGEKVLQRHLINRQRIRGRVEMAGSIDMCPRMVAHRKIERLGAELRGTGLFDLTMIAPDRSDNGGMRRVSRGAMENLPAQVNDPHDNSSPIGFLSGCERVKRLGRAPLHIDKFKV